MKKCLLIFFSIIFQICLVQAEPLYILNEYCTNNIYSSAVAALSHCDGVAIKRDIRGIIIRIPFENPEYNFQKITPQLYEKLLCIEYFLAKIKNPVKRRDFCFVLFNIYHSLNAHDSNEMHLSDIFEKFVLNKAQLNILMIRMCCLLGYVCL